MNLDAPLVLLPGMNCTDRLWRPAVTEAGVQGDVVFGALRGRSVDETVDDVLSSVPARFSLVGLSLGAVVAAAVVRRAPERVLRLALFDCNLTAPTGPQMAGWRRTRQELGRGLTAEQYQRNILDLLVAHPEKAERADAVVAMGRATGEQRLDDQLATQLSRREELTGLEQLQGPLLVARGSEDRLCPQERHQEIVDLAGGTVEAIADAGHLSPMEEPGAVGALMRRWLQS